MKPAWKKIGGKIIHKNPWYRVREDDVIRPNGSKGKYFVVENNNSIAVIAEDKDKNIYLVGQTRYPIGNIYSWEIITGGIDKNSTPLASAKRELREEAGITAKRWTNLGHFYTSNGLLSDKCYIFLAQDLTNSKQKLDESEDISVKIISLKKLLLLIKSNKITDGLTVVAIFRYLLRNNNINF